MANPDPHPTPPYVTPPRPGLALALSLVVALALPAVFVLVGLGLAGRTWALGVMFLLVTAGLGLWVTSLIVAVLVVHRAAEKSRARALGVVALVTSVLGLVSSTFGAAAGLLLATGGLARTVA